MGKTFYEQIRASVAGEFSETCVNAIKSDLPPANFTVSDSDLWIECEFSRSGRREVQYLCPFCSKFLDESHLNGQDHSYRKKRILSNEGLDKRYLEKILEDFGVMNPEFVLAQWERLIPLSSDSS